MAIPLVVIYGLMFLWILSFTYLYYRKISCMLGMMIAMTLGMTLGLGIGTVFGLLLPEQFVKSTVVSMLAGGTLGFIAGLPISMMAVLDGFLSGVMGGMMGTMLVVMIPSNDMNTIIKILAVLTAGILFILFLLMQSEIKFKENNWKRYLFGKKEPLFVVVCLFLILANQYQMPAVQAMPKSSGHSMDNMSMPKPNKSQPSAKLVVKATEFSFTPTLIDLKPGEAIDLILQNNGKIEHDLQIVGTNIHVHAQPGKQDETTFLLLKSGKYKAVCTLPGHKEAGMVSIINVS